MAMTPPPSARCPECDASILDHACLWNISEGRADYIFCSGRQIPRAEFLPPTEEGERT